MKAVYRDAKYFKEILKGLSLWFDPEVTFKVTPEGLFLKQTDPSRVMLAKLEVPKYDFEEFEADVERHFTVNIEDLVKNTLKNIYKDDQIILRLSEDRLLISLKSDMERKFSVPLLENPTDLEYPEPKINFTYMAKLTVEGLRKILEDAKAEHVRLVADSDGLTFTSDADLVNFSVKLQRGSDHLLDIETNEPFVKASYSTEWLKSFAKALKPLVDVVTLQYSTDLPMQIETHLRGNSMLRVWLAPRIEVEEEPLTEEKPKEEETTTEEITENIPEQYVVETTEIEAAQEIQKEEKEDSPGRDLNPPVFFTEVVFLREVSEIVGEDMKTYGPFKEGDKAEVPLRNAEALITQGLAASWFMWNTAQAKWRETHTDPLEKPSIQELKQYLS